MRFDLELNLNDLNNYTPEEQTILDPISDRIFRHKDTVEALKDAHKENSMNDTIVASEAAQNAVGLMQGIVANEADSPEEKARKAAIPDSHKSRILTENLGYGDEFKTLQNQYLADVQKKPLPDNVYETYFQKFVTFLDKCEARFDALEQFYITVAAVDKGEQSFTEKTGKPSKRSDQWQDALPDSSNMDFSERTIQRKSNTCCCIC